MKKLLICIVLTGVWTSLAIAGPLPNMKEGRWEITTSMEMPGMPVKMPPSTHTQCLTKKDMVPQNNQKNQGCTIKDQKVSGDTVSWSIECASGGSTTIGSGTITYKGDSFSGTVDMTVKGMGMKMKSTMKGRRLGACK